MRKLFCDGMIYNSASRSFVRADILVEDTQIVKMEEEVDILLADEIVDCEGKFIIPGFVDVHSHGRTKLDFNNVKSADDVRDLRESYAKVGTTTFMATLASAPYDDLVTSANASKCNCRDSKYRLKHVLSPIPSRRGSL